MKTLLLFVKVLFSVSFLPLILFARLAKFVLGGRKTNRALASSIQTLTQQAIASLGVPAEQLFVEVAEGVKLHTVVAGPPDGELLVLLHGFPECWLSWHAQIAPLAKAGYRVVAADMRGYNLSSKPSNAKNYNIRLLVADVVALIKHFRRESAVIIAHDWGGAIAWAVGMFAPNVVKALIIANGPHPASFMREYRNTIEQKLRSWYIVFFQIPVLPELLMTLDPLTFFKRLYASSSLVGSLPEAELRYNAAAILQKGSATAMLNYYRAYVRGGGGGPTPTLATVTAPTLHLWGVQDEALSVRMTEGLEKLVPNMKCVLFDNASHWILADAPAQVTENILKWLPTVLKSPKL